MAARIEQRPPQLDDAKDAGVSQIAGPLFAPPEQPQERGYVERCVVAIRDFVVSIFRKIGAFFGCLAPPKKPRDLEMEFLQPEMQNQLRLMRRLGRLPEQTQTYICMQIGRGAAPESPSNEWLEIGRAKIMENADVLKKFIKG